MVGAVEEGKRGGRAHMERGRAEEEGAGGVGQMKVGVEVASGWGWQGVVGCEVDERWGFADPGRAGVGERKGG